MNYKIIDKTSVTKHKLLQMFAKDDTIFNLINNKSDTIEYPEDLIGINLFPYLKVDYTVEESGTFIGVKIEYPNINQSNYTYKDTRITVLIVCDNKSLATKSGYIRTDLVAERIVELLNYNRCFGYELRLVSDSEDPLNEKYYYRKLMFKSEANNTRKFI